MPQVARRGLPPFRAVYRRPRLWKAIDARAVMRLYHRLIASRCSSKHTLPPSLPPSHLALQATNVPRQPMLVLGAAMLLHTASFYVAILLYDDSRV